MVPGFVTVYAEATPNPESVKFVFNGDIVEVGGFDFPTEQAAQGSPLARELFKFNFVKGVYIGQDFVTISKVDDAMWAELIPIIRTFLKEYIINRHPVLSQEFKAAGAGINDNDPEAVKKIKEILNSSVKPVVEQDGGNIEFKSFDEEQGVVTVALRGSCSGCPSSTVTLKSGIENLLKRLVPQVKQVVAEAV